MTPRKANAVATLIAQTTALTVASLVMVGAVLAIRAASGERMAAVSVGIMLAAAIFGYVRAEVERRRDIAALDQIIARVDRQRQERARGSNA